jgi:hypothetical protein
MMRSCSLNEQPQYDQSGCMHEVTLKAKNTTIDMSSAHGDHDRSSRNNNEGEKTKTQGNQYHSIHQVRKRKRDSYSSMPIPHAKDHPAFQGNRMHGSRKHALITVLLRRYE